ncbi:hypothetical protein [Sphingopyxis sp. PET50]|uniref:hypothetical protein n=1 Tax=Sphingopyxis sp. PET50 TaxID=2976533 RepID=UPI0021B03812|nr:hypothetical protein [Sphingopyxis sp. PET50]
MWRLWCGSSNSRQDRLPAEVERHAEIIGIEQKAKALESLLDDIIERSRADPADVRAPAARGADIVLHSVDQDRSEPVEDVHILVDAESRIDLRPVLAVIGDPPVTVEEAMVARAARIEMIGDLVIGIVVERAQHASLPRGGPIHSPGIQAFCAVEFGA